MKTGNLVLVALFAVLTAIGALIVVPIPFSPVPITLQTLFTILSGAVIGKNRAMFSQLLYVFIGIAGLPVFSRGASGIGVLFGPTGGYIIGFVVGAYLCGLLVEKNRIMIGMIAGMVVIYFMGVIQLKFVLNIKMAQAFMVGVIPFLPGCVVKVVVAFGIYIKLKKTGILENI